MGRLKVESENGKWRRHQLQHWDDDDDDGDDGDNDDNGNTDCADGEEPKARMKSKPGYRQVREVAFK